MDDADDGADAVIAPSPLRVRLLTLRRAPGREVWRLGCRARLGQSRAQSRTPSARLKVAASLSALPLF